MFRVVYVTNKTEKRPFSACSLPFRVETLFPLSMCEAGKPAEGFRH